MRRGILTVALAGAAFAASSPAFAGGPPTLHGFCNSNTPCPDLNNTNSPTSVNPPQFGFWSSPGNETGTLLVDILVPDNVAAPGPFAITGAETGTATLFSSTAWTGGFLADYLGLPSGTTPKNPLDAFLPAAQGFQGNTDTGFWVYQTSFSNVTLSGSANNSNLMDLSGDLPQGSYIVGFLDQKIYNKKCDCYVDAYGATANSGAILETSRPVPEPASWAMMLLGFGGVGVAMRRRRRGENALMQVA